MSESELVYSTEVGRIKTVPTPPEKAKGDGIVCIQRQVSGRKGSAVCVISGLDLTESELKSLATELKKRCACGGAIKNHCIEIQGDKRPLIKQLLEQKGFQVKFIGG